MTYNDVLTKVIFLTKRNNLSQKELGDAINVERKAMNGRAQRNSEFKEIEIEKLEKHYNIKLSNVSITENTFETKDDSSITEKTKDFTRKLNQIQKSTSLNDNNFAKYIGLTIEEYREFKSGDRIPNLKILNAVKQKFKVSVDWLLYGE